MAVKNCQGYEHDISVFGHTRLEASPRVMVSESVFNIDMVFLIDFKTLSPPRN